MTLSGDEAIVNPGLRQTRAVQVDAPPHAGWPWVAQTGQDRGGFYSYTWLENLAGCQMTNERPAGVASMSPVSPPVAIVGPVVAAAVIVT